MRQHFLLDPEVTFLNHGSFGATPRVVLQAQQRAQLEMERNPVAYLGRASAALLASARQRLAAEIGARGEDLVFVPNASTGVNIVARSLALAPGDEVLTTDHEYGACVATWQRRCVESGAVLRTVAVPLPFEPEAFAERLLAACTPRTRLVFVSHITSTTAIVFPLRALCAAARERGVITLVDGAHAPGQVALDLAAIGADFYTGNCHKWMCAPKGSAFLHVRPDRLAGPVLLEAPVVSWGYVAEQAEDEGAVDGAASGGLAVGRTGHTGFDAYTGRTPLERRLQWQGTRDLSAFLSVPAAIEFQAAHDWPAWRRRCHDMAIELQREVLARNGLAPVAPDDALAQMVPIPVRTPATGDHAEALRRWLCDERRIEVPVTQHAGQVLVRASVQAYNTHEDLERLRDALAAAGV
ncbi:MAG: aminotransferase class V-fold PLP-dependent enzyme [Burkholderiales bacterium]|nr:aminotransferase class V-fold PLP-dependent enzyme [Burkholderiales bacterium]